MSAAVRTWHAADGARSDELLRMMPGVRQLTIFRIGDATACMSERDRFLISEIPGFTPQIGRLVSIMNYVRFTTFSAVAGLGVNELDYLHDSESNSIGALLSHIAAAEVGYQAATFYGRGLSVSRLEQVRAKTLAELGRRKDQWLEDRTSSSGGQEVNNYFKWFHVFGHEINHRGQIRWSRTRATSRPS